MLGETIILQRTIPHYRIPLFQELYSKYGWKVVTSKRVADKSLKIESAKHEFILEFPFVFPKKGDPHLSFVPLSAILRETKALNVISEFGIRMSSTYELLARRAVGGPSVVFWTHGYNASRGVKSVADKLSHKLHRELLKRADACVCYSETGLHKLENLIPSDRLFVAHNTIDLSPMEALSSKIGIVSPPGSPHLISVGRITAEKNFPMLVRAFKLFKAVYHNAVLTIIGGGPSHSDLVDLVGDMPGVRLLGEVYCEETLAREFLSADLFVYGGKIGLAANHALAYGLPVMIFDSGTFEIDHAPEAAYVIPNVTGFRVSEFSEQALTSELLKVFSNPVGPRSLLRDSIKDFVSNNISLSSMVSDFGAVDVFLKQHRRR